MLERPNIAYRMLKCVSLSNARDLDRFESRLDDLGDALGKHLDKKWGD